MTEEQRTGTATGGSEPRKEDRMLAMLRESVDLSPAGRLSPDELVTQLEIHRVELEMQNQELRETQVHLERTRHRYFTLFDISPVGYFVLDQAGVVTELNLLAADMVGVERARLLRKNLLHQLCTERLASFDAFLQAVFSDQRRHRVEVTFRAGGNPVHVQVDGLQLPSLDGEPPYCLLVCTDVSERKRAEEERIRIERQAVEGQRLESIGLLAGGVAHDFNNLLTGVLGNLGVIEESVGPHAREHDAVQQAIQCARRAADLCQQLLAYAGRARFVIQPIDLNEVCTETLKLVRSNYAGRARVVIESEARLPRVLADPTQVGQVILNFLINAFESIERPPGSITVRTGVQNLAPGRRAGETTTEAGEVPPGRYVFVEVADSGCGMPPDVRQRIFEPFFTTKFAGRGLGLAASAGIAKSHRGTIHATSTPGGGTVFRLLLPEPDAALVPRVEAPPARVPVAAEVVAADEWVLVVDDEEPVRKVAIRGLQRIGFLAVEAACGDEALRLIKEGGRSIRFVLMDLTMPGMNGAELLSELRRILPGVPVVVMSGFCEDDVLKRLEGRAPEGFLPKPFNADLLRQRVVHVRGLARRGSSS
ncbi:MAG: response regulator [Verrucomicrobiales bacterium]|nr:response regulator [Verrucomicrobiales bacterium]